MEKNLQDKEAIEKFTKLAMDIRTCMFITNNNEDEHTRPMATMEAEEDGTLWFFTNVHSVKVDEIKKEREVHLTYAHPGKESYLDVWGTATVITDKQQLKEKWSPIVKAWFPGGVDDPELALLKVTPRDCYYWDAATGSMIQFLKMAVGAAIGKPQIAEGEEGKLSL